MPLGVFQENLNMDMKTKRMKALEEWEELNDDQQLALLVRFPPQRLQSIIKEKLLSHWLTGREIEGIVTQAHQSLKTDL